MAIELIVPSVGESIVEVQIGEWLVGEGESVAEGDPVVEIESDKATVELPAPVSGVVSGISKKTGETAAVGEVVGHMEEGKVAATAKSADANPAAEAAPAAAAASSGGEARVMPAAERALAQKGLAASDVTPSGPGGRILKEDVMDHGGKAAAPTPAAPAPTTPGALVRTERTVPMTPMRKRIAQRLVEAQQNAALLTTFNEIDMGAVMAMRKEFQEEFIAKHEVKLGFMSFFVKAAVDAMRAIPQVNAQIDGENIVYYDYCDVGIAVGGGKGLVVPILRNAEAMGFADVEKTIGDFGARAKKNRIGLDELTGGTFSITNGGVYGSLLSTPIVNPPQSAILGLHAIQQRPVAIDGEVVIRPMMNVALTYDHRLVDGREAVTFLVHIKKTVENPTRLLLDI
jgi:2-oxoglutarate dehydrogenase E2 component (dihydrolipoamide succinyltransferase)